MALGIIGFSVFLALSFGITAALVSDIFFDDDSQTEAQADADPSSEFDELRASAVSTDDPLGFALGLTEDEAGTLLDESQLEPTRQDALARLSAEPETPASGNGNLVGTPGDDIIRAADDVTAIDSLDGDDLLAAGLGTSEVFADGGDDIVLGGSGPGSTLDEGENAVLFGGSGDDIVFGGEGDDRISGEAGDDIMLGGGGDDDLITRRAGTNMFFGGAGDDDINRFNVGEAFETGLEVVNAGAGDDFVTLGLGTTLVELGEGQDRLIMLNSNEALDDDPLAVVTDFTPGEDRIFLGVLAKDPDILAGEITRELALTLRSIETNQGPATLVEPDLSDVEGIDPLTDLNLSGVILVGVTPSQLQAGDITALLTDNAGITAPEDDGFNQLVGLAGR